MQFAPSSRAALVTGTIALALLAAAVPAAARPRAARPTFQDGEVEVLVNGRAAPHYFRAGAHHVLARKGDRYTLRLWNRSAMRVEAVVSVDGRDVLDGQPADYRGKRGFVVPGNGYVDVDGWRLGIDEVAAFRFSELKDAYAARSGARADVGVIGVAFFPEGMETHVPWMPRVPRPPLPPPWPSSTSPAGPPALATSLDANVPPPRPSLPPLAKPAPPAAKPAPQAKPAPSVPARADVAAPTTPTPESTGLGTAFGERLASPVREISFVRLDPQEPAQIFVLRYNDRAGLRALGIDVDVPEPGPVAEEAERRRAANPFPNSTRTYAAPPPGWKR
jgi:hypothetical protein